jgi:hypothetical protein
MAKTFLASLPDEKTLKSSRDNRSVSPDVAMKKIVKFDERYKNLTKLRHTY